MIFLSLWWNITRFSGIFNMFFWFFVFWISMQWYGDGQMSSSGIRHRHLIVGTLG
jgi:hypothetical protein